MRVTFCGVRGSTPSPGAAFVRYGGHTSCVAFSRAGESPSLLIDGGTGLRNVPALMGGAPFRGALLLSHLHWDHVQGLPFFRAADDGCVSVFVPDPGDGEDPSTVIGRMIGPPLFPLRVDELRGDWAFTALGSGPHNIFGWSVLALDIPHPGGRTFGYRISDGSATVAFMTDHSPTTLGAGPQGVGVLHDHAIRLAKDADVLIHDAQHTSEELGAKAFLGHACSEYAVQLAESAGARRVALFHHDPDRTDPEVDEILAAARAHARVDVTAAAEGAVLHLND